MTKSYSIYLDFVRFFAALLVLLYHSTNLYNPGLAIFTLGHEAVIIFFVLSGFVIAYVADTKENTLKKYAISRMARIYSVAVPALLLTGLLDFAGWQINPAAYPPDYQAWDYAPVRLLSSLLFTNELWTLSLQAFSNVPYWSLNYEVWYYVSFALITYVGGRKGWLLFGLTALLLGPKIAVLAPLWWAGVLIYRSQRFRTLSNGAAWGLIALSVVGAYFYIAYGIGTWGSRFLREIVGEQLHVQFAFSRFFISDYFLALVVGAHFVGARVLCSRYDGVLYRFEAPIRTVAASTFTLYLIHQPLLIFFHAVFYASTPGPRDLAVVIACTLVAALALAAVTERKKHLWKRWITIAWEFFENRTGRLFGTHRGLVRLIIANLFWLVGPYRKYGRVEFGKVKRLVFVCQGNVCRSPFAHYLASGMIKHVPVASMGLATSSGASAFTTAIAVAPSFSIDLQPHVATDVRDFEIRDGDLFLVMEDRHVERLRPYVAGRDVQVALLGLWCRPRFALLYDPHGLTTDYFKTCFDRIKRSVARLADELNRNSGAV